MTSLPHLVSSQGFVTENKIHYEESSRPILTVAIPVFNRATLIIECIESVLAQKCAGVEIVVIDNASTDGTWEAIQKYGQAGVRLFRNANNIGLFGNLDRCLTLSQASFIKILCSDDRLCPGTLSRELAALTEDPHTAMVCTKGTLIDEHGRPSGFLPGLLAPGYYHKPVGLIVRRLIVRALNPLNYPSGITFRADIAKVVGGFNGQYRIAADVDYFLRLLRFGALRMIDHVGVCIMRHSGQEGDRLQTKNSTIILRDMLSIAAKHRLAHSVRMSPRRIRSGVSAIGLLLCVRPLFARKFSVLAHMISWVSRMKASPIGITASLIVLLLYKYREVLTRKWSVTSDASLADTLMGETEVVW